MARRSWLCIAITWLVLTALAAQPALAEAPSTWSTPEKLSSQNTQYDLLSASIAIDGAGRVHVVWSNGSTIFHRVRSGGAWSPALASPPTTVTAGFAPHLVAGSQKVHMTFMDPLIISESNVYYVGWSLADGWGAVQPVSTTEGSRATAPKIAALPGSPDQLAVVWSEDTSQTSASGDVIYLGRSEDGSAWVKQPVPNAKGSRPVIAFEAATDLLVAWEDEFDPDYAPQTEIWASRLVGASWSLPVDVSSTPSQDSVSSAMAVVAGTAYLAWQESTTDGQVAALSEQPDGGWADPVTLSGPEGGYEPALAGDAQSRAHLVWTVGSSVLHRSRGLGESAWGATQTLAGAQTGANGAQVAAGNGVHVAWLASDGSKLQVWYSAAAGEPPPSYTLLIPLVIKP